MQWPWLMTLVINKVKSSLPKREIPILILSQFPRRCAPSVFPVNRKGTLASKICFRQMKDIDIKQIVVLIALMIKGILSPKYWRWILTSHVICSSYVNVINKNIYIWIYDIDFWTNESPVRAFCTSEAKSRLI